MADYAKAFKVSPMESKRVYDTVKQLIFDLENQDVDRRAAYSAFRGVMGEDMVVSLMADNYDEEILGTLLDIVGREEVPLPLDLINQLDLKRRAARFAANLSGKRNSEATHEGGQSIPYKPD